MSTHPYHSCREIYQEHEVYSYMTQTLFLSFVSVINAVEAGASERAHIKIYYRVISKNKSLFIPWLENNLAECSTSEFFNYHAMVHNK